MFTTISASSAAARCSAAVSHSTFPSQTPVIYGLSVDTSAVGVYTLVTVTGERFVVGGATARRTGGITGNTSVYITANSGSGQVTIVSPIVFYSSLQIGFSVPQNLGSGVYTIRVAVKSHVPGGNGVGMAAATSLLFSNAVTYTISAP